MKYPRSGEGELKSNDRCPYKKRRRQRDTEKKAMGHMEMEAETEAMLPQTEATARGATRRWKNRGGSSLGEFGGTMFLLIP